jgi:hypothetical protein
MSKQSRVKIFKSRQVKILIIILSWVIASLVSISLYKVSANTPASPNGIYQWQVPDNPKTLSVDMEGKHFQIQNAHGNVIVSGEISSISNDNYFLNGDMCSYVLQVETNNKYVLFEVMPKVGESIQIKKVSQTPGAVN